MIPNNTFIEKYRLNTWRFPSTAADGNNGKDIFWGPEETVIQYHPPKSEYVNNHPSVLHLWRPTGVDLPLPPSILTGIKSLGTLKT